MTELDEKLAYLLDDHPVDDVDSAIADATADVNLQYRLRRYRMIGEVMRHEVPWVIDTDFHNRVMQKVRAQAADSRPAAARSTEVSVENEAQAKPSWLNWLTLKPLAGLAVAATVAVVTVTLWQPRQQGASEDDFTQANAGTSEIEKLIEQPLQGTQAFRASTGGMRWIIERDSPALQQKLNAYLVNHTEYSNSVQGLIPQARVAGYDAQQ